MADKVEKKHIAQTGRGQSQIIGFRLPISLAKAIKVEAARRQLPLNALLAEMRQICRENKRAG